MRPLRLSWCPQCRKFGSAEITRRPTPRGTEARRTEAPGATLQRLARETARERPPPAESSSRGSLPVVPRAKPPYLVVIFVPFPEPQHGCQKPNLTDASTRYFPPCSHEAPMPNLPFFPGSSNLTSAAQRCSVG